MIFIIPIVEVNGKCEDGEVFRIKCHLVGISGKVYGCCCDVLYIDVIYSDIGRVCCCLVRFFYIFIERKVEDINVLLVLRAQSVRDLGLLHRN